MQQRGKMDDRIDSLHRRLNGRGIGYIADAAFQRLPATAPRGADQGKGS